MNDWFEWNGVRCTDYGMHVLSQPSIISPIERVQTIKIPGRSGALTYLEGQNVYEELMLGCSCVIDDANRIDEICGWLKGSGDVIFANRPEGLYKARLANQIGFDKILRNHPHMTFQIQFRCDPFFYLLSGLTVSHVIASPKTLINLGNIPSKPLLKIKVSGDGTIMCGSSTMFINSLDGITYPDGTKYIIIDCEAKLAYKGSKATPTDLLTLLSTRVGGDWLTIPEGTSYLSFTSGIDWIDITPRWRNV